MEYIIVGIIAVCVFAFTTSVVAALWKLCCAANRRCVEYERKMKEGVK